MIAAALFPNSTPHWFRQGGIAASLGLFAGGPAAFAANSHSCFAQLHGPRRPARPGTSWHPYRSETGATVLFDGTIDNSEELAQRLDLPPDAPVEALYAAAVERWGTSADARIVGQYTSIVAERGGSLRLARSPWNGPSLFFMVHGGIAMAASIPRVFFAAGFPKRLKRDQIAESLYLIEDLSGGYWYEGLNYVGHGTTVTIDPDGRWHTHGWYDPHAIEPVRYASDRDYVERAEELLREAVTAALRPARKPGILLSGGLDSSIVADEMLRQLQPHEKLHSFTFVPRGDFDETPPPGMFFDDRPLVEAFAAEHPGLETHFSDNADYDFDGLYDRFLLAGDIGRPSSAISAAYHGPAMLAAETGCDWLFHAAMGNNSFSQDGRWAYVEFARTGRWLELWRMARDHPGDARPMWRRILARSILPQFPASMREVVRTIVHGRQPPLNRQASLLKDLAIERLDLDRRAQRTGDRRSGEWFKSRREWLATIWRLHDLGAEQHHAAEQVYGLKLRDVTAYRPLIEFCAAIPTQQFVAGGVQRLLARRMAEGRLPESQRANTDYGQHNVDWHLRMSKRLPELREEIARMESVPELAQLIDTQRAYALLDHWPDTTPRDPRTVRAHFHALTGAILAARFHRYVSGTNH